MCVCVRVCVCALWRAVAQCGSFLQAACLIARFPGEEKTASSVLVTGERATEAPAFFYTLRSSASSMGTRLQPRTHRSSVRHTWAGQGMPCVMTQAEPPQPPPPPSPVYVTSCESYTYIQAPSERDTTNKRLEGKDTCQKPLGFTLRNVYA